MINNGGAINSITFSGVITETEFAPAAFVSEVIFDYLGLVSVAKMYY